MRRLGSSLASACRVRNLICIALVGVSVWAAGIGLLPIGPRPSIAVEAKLVTEVTAPVGVRWPRYHTLPWWNPYGSAASPLVACVQPESAKEVPASPVSLCVFQVNDGRLTGTGPGADSVSDRESGLGSAFEVELSGRAIVGDSLDSMSDEASTIPSEPLPKV